MMHARDKEPTSARTDHRGDLERAYYKLLDDYGLSAPEPLPSAKELLVTLRKWIKEHPKKDVRKVSAEATQCFKSLMKQLGFREQEFYDSVRNEPIIRVSRYLALLTRFVPSLTEDLTQRVYLAEFPTGDFNANARRTENGYLCLINTGLTELLYHMAVVVTYRVKGKLSEDASASFYLDLRDNKDIAEIIGAALMTVYTYLAHSEHRRPEHFSQQHSEWGTLISNAFSHAAITFVVAHEFAHVLLGHLESEKTYALATPVGELQVLTRSHAQEFAADAEAQRMLLQICRSLSIGFKGILAVGGIAFLETDRLVCLFRDKMLRAPFVGASSTHPASGDRISRLLNLFQSELDSETFTVVLRLWSLYGTLRLMLSKSEMRKTEDGWGLYLPYDLNLDRQTVRKNMEEEMKRHGMKPAPEEDVFLRCSPDTDEKRS